MTNTNTRRTLTAFFLILLFFFAGQTHAQESATPPHVEEDSSVGQFQGFIFTQKAGAERVPLAEQPMQLTVFQNEQSVLALPKVSGADGKFVVKNIFRDPAFEYSLSTEYQGKAYGISHLKLTGDQRELSVNFLVGPGSPHEFKNAPTTNVRKRPAPPQPQSTKTATRAAHKPTADLSDWQRPFNIVTTLLVLVVLGLAAHYYTRKQS